MKCQNVQNALQTHANTNAGLTLPSSMGLSLMWTTGPGCALDDLEGGWGEHNRRTTIKDCQSL